MAKFITFVDKNGNESVANVDQIIRLGHKLGTDEFFLQINGLFALSLDHDEWLKVYQQLKAL